jgi:hypothetical protein
MQLLDEFKDTYKTPIQKLIVLLFATTIILCCTALVWIQIEKPDKVTYRCEELGKFIDSHNFTVGEKTDLSSQLRPACPKTVNPPMSAGLVAVINLATVTGIVFVGLAGYAYIAGKKKEQGKEPPS